MSLIYDYILGKLRVKDVTDLTTVNSRITTLENNVYKILYFQAISAATGTITKPTNSTILLDQFYSGGDAIVETLSNGQPTGQSPLTGGGSVVSVTSFDVNGNYVLSGTPSAFDVALVYILTIKAVDYGNLNVANIMAMEEISPTSGFVPYTGATSNIDIGLHDFTANGSIYANTFNAVIITEPLGTATLTISDGKTLTVSNDATVSGTNTGDQDLSALAPKASPTFTGTVTTPAIVLSSETANTIASFDASKNIKSLDTATYPSLTELSYVKGVTQSIQPLLTDTRTRKVSVQSNTDASTSATIAETVLKTLLVPTLGANTTLKIMSEVGKVGVAVNAVFKMYYNTTPDLSGTPVQIALLTFTLTQVYAPFNRDITNKNSVTANSIFASNSSSVNSVLTTNARTDLNVNLSGKYIVITGKAGSVLDSVRVENARLLIEE